MAAPALSLCEFLASSAPLVVQIQRAQQKKRSKVSSAPITLLGRRLSVGKRQEDAPDAAGSFLTSFLPCLTKDEGHDDLALEVVGDGFKDKYINNQALSAALHSGDTVLIKGSWLVRKWRAERAKQATPMLLRRQEIEESHPHAVWSVDELYRSQAKGAVNIVAVSLSWLGSDHPDPHGKNLDALCCTIDLMLKSTPLQDLALYIDYCSLYQSPRTTEQDVAFTRSMAHTHLWFLHQGTRVWMLSNNRVQCSRSRMERALGDMLHSSSFLLDLDKLDNTCTTWQRVLAVCRHTRRPPTSPNAFAGMVSQSVSESKERRTIATTKYEEGFLEAIVAAKELSFSSLGWGDEEANLIAQIMPQCVRLEKIALHGNNITEVGARALINAAPKCAALQELWLIQNPVSKTKRETRENLLDAWARTGRCPDHLRM